MKYMPIFRSRQQEIKVLSEFDFGENIFPMVEVIKAKDRVNNKQPTNEIYSKLVKEIIARKVFIDLPVYIKLSSGTIDEVVKFTRAITLDLGKRIDFYKKLNYKRKVIPVISGLQSSGHKSAITKQFQQLKSEFGILAFRTYYNTFDEDIIEIEKCISSDDYFIYDLDTIAISNPLFKMHRHKIIKSISQKKVLVKSAINTDIQNINLDHEKIIAEADNSLVEQYKALKFDAFGDYVGIKKDDITAGGSISPGFIFYDPLYNVYYGFKGNKKSLAEFESTIVPSVLNSNAYTSIQSNGKLFLTGNKGIGILKQISSNKVSGKNQALFKRISMLHYLNCMKVAVDNNIDMPYL